MKYFWDNNFLNKHEKREYNRIVKISIFLQYISWVAILLFVIAIFTAQYFPRIIYNEHWPKSTKLVVKTVAYLYTFIAYYMAITHVCFYVYTILHGYLQMKTLKAYLRHEFREYEKIDLNKKMYSYKYQSLVGGAFLRCIKQHKRVVT